MFEGRNISRQYTTVLDTTVEATTIRDRLPEIVFPLMQPFYELFDFFKLSMSLVQEELAKVRSGRF
jgi:hypothetical protein